MDNSGKLFIVTTPIGDYSDITIRGLRMLEDSSIVICEEFKEAARLLRFFGLKKELISLNEHNELSRTDEIAEELLQGKTMSLISDCGSPGFSDPGNALLNKCFNAGIQVEFCGGPNSVLTALVLCGFDISRFYYYGFLSPKKELRRTELKNMSGLDRPSILMEAPYRLTQILSDISEVFLSRKIFVGFDLTMKSEKQFRGTAGEILEQIGEERFKGEFVIIIDKP